MHRTAPFKKLFQRHFVVGGMGLFMTCGLIGQVRADDPLGDLTNTATGTAPSAPTKASAGTDAKLPATPSAPTAPQPAAKSGSEDFGGLSIDQLLDVTVTSAGQKEQKLSDVAAAMTVITSDDIERSGATNIPDLLRYVPGVEVGQANNSDYSVAIRGFSGIFSSKLLVLVDGRSIYDPVFAGVDWGFQRLVMEDIDRVEVIRGPGATIWGANAVNGVINIITKDAGHTQGGFISGIYGTKEQGTGTFRYGFQPVQDLSLRLYGQYNNVVADNPMAGVSKYDALQDGLIGFRADYRPDADDHYRLSGEAVRTRLGDEQFGEFPIPAYTQTGDAENVNFVYEHVFAADNELTLQSYYDRFSRGSSPPDQFESQTVQTIDVQARHTLSINLLPIKQELIYGAEYREVDSRLGDTQTAIWVHHHRANQTASLFAQTDLHLIDNVLTLTMGAKYDHNDFTGNEVQPSARLLWKINDRNSLWWSVSRAVREPALLEVNTTGFFNGNTNLKSEELIAYEMGYRVEPADWLSIDIAGYYNTYKNPIEFYFASDTGTLDIEQFQKAQTYGIEPSFTAQVQPWCRLTGSYSLVYFHTDNSGVPANFTFSGIPSGAPLESGDSRNETSLKSSFDLPNNIDIDLGGRYVEKIPGANSYFAFDARIGWKPNKNWEIALVGQNLLAGNHLENPGAFSNATYVGPEVYGKVTFKF